MMRFVPASQGVRAVIVLLAGVMMLDIAGTFVKSLMQDYTALELSAYRNAIGVIPSLLLMYFTGELKVPWKNLIIRQYKIAIFRGVFVAMAQLLYYLSLAELDFAVASALIYTVSLFTVAFSVPVLGEKVGPVRWVAVCLGFVGALWIVRPGAGMFSIYALLPLAAAALYAFSSVAVRLIDKDVSNALLYLYSAVSAAAISFVLAMMSSGFTPIAHMQDLLSIFAMGMFGGVGVLGLLVAFRMATPSLLAPFNYLGLLSAFFWGWMIFGEAPFRTLFPGAFIIVAGGLLIVWREQRLKKK